MVNWAMIRKNGIGPRTIYKSYQVSKNGVTASDKSLFDSFLIDGKTLLAIHKKAQIINNGYFTLGIGYTDFFPSTAPCQLRMDEGSKLVINGSARIGKGVVIGAQKNACIELGDNVVVNSNTVIIASKSIKVGSNSLISWDVELLDTDFHGIAREGAVVAAPIEIGRHVFIGRRVLVLKGVKIGDGSVIGAGAVVTKDIPEKCLAAGVPAHVIKKDVNWEY